MAQELKEYYVEIVITGIVKAANQEHATKLMQSGVCVPLCLGGPLSIIHTKEVTVVRPEPNDLERAAGEPIDPTALPGQSSEHTGP